MDEQNIIANIWFFWAAAIIAAGLLLALVIYHFISSRRGTTTPAPAPNQDVAPEPATEETATPDLQFTPIEQWVAARHFTHPEVTIDMALQQMGIEQIALDTYLEKTGIVYFRKWISFLRVEEAKRLLLEHPDYTLQAIAEACGYANNGNLTRSFKLQEGMPPSRWVAKQKRLAFNALHHKA